MVHPDDRKRYLDFIEQLASEEQTLTIQYRMICKDGSIIRMSDTMSSRHLEDGRMYGFAVVADITDRKDCKAEPIPTVPTQILNSYGYLQCTCDKHPKVTHINNQMMTYLGVTEEDSEWHDFLKENLFSLLPFEERDMFRNYMEEVRISDAPIHIQHHFFHKGGHLLTMNGWMSSVENSSGEKEYALIYMKVGDDDSSYTSTVDSSYFHALENAYGVIFEINLAKQTVECIHGRDTSEIGPLYDVHMTIESAKNFWLNNYILKEDRKVMTDFLDRISNVPKGWRGSPVIQAEFRFRWTNNIIYKMIGVAVQVDSSNVLLCLRDISNVKYSGLPGKESAALENFQHWIDSAVVNNKSALGIFVFEKSETGFSILYMSRRFSDYLDLDQNEYLSYMSGDRSMEQFLETFVTSPCTPEDLTRSGQMTLNIRHRTADGDFADKQVWLVSHSVPQESTILYELLVYDKVPGHSTPDIADMTEKHVFARTFGHFDLFVNDVPVTFSNKKEKEFMALLIDRNGGTITTEDAIGHLWENEEVNEQVSRRYRKLCTSLKNTLIKYGIEHILINNRGVRSINVSAITCDYYELLAGNPKYLEAL
jgi:hypothetical protein